MLGGRSRSGSRWMGPSSAYGLGVALPCSTFHLLTGSRSVSNYPPMFLFLCLYQFQSPDLLVNFFIFLAFSKESDLGFDTEIERVNDSDFELRFLIQGTDYLTSRVLYDVGADSMCGRGTWVFEAYPRGQVNPTPRAVKDCWVEDREGKEMEHMIVEKVRAAIGHSEFCKYFVDVCGYRKVKNEVLDRFCIILSDAQFDVQGNTLTLSWNGKANHDVTYSQLGQAFVDGQDSYLQQNSGVTRPRQPHRRFRYQIVYAERGTSLYDVTSLSETFGYLVQVTDGTKLVVIAWAAVNTPV